MKVYIVYAYDYLGYDGCMPVENMYVYTDAEKAKRSYDKMVEAYTYKMSHPKGAGGPEIPMEIEASELLSDGMTTSILDDYHDGVYVCMKIEEVIE